MKDDEIQVEEQELASVELEKADSVIRQEVEEIKEAVENVVTESPLSEKVEELRTNLENISEEVESWRTWQKNTYLEVMETLKTQVEEIQSEWNNVSAGMKTQRERLESLLDAFPGVIETSTIKALSLRVAHLERLTSQLFQESQASSRSIGTRKQFIISVVALGVTVILWVAFFVLNVIG